MGSQTRLKKLFSLSGVVPLGAFVLLHLWTAAALLGPHALYDRQIAWLHGSTILGALEILLILAPLTFHACYGLWLAREATPREHAYDSDLMLVLERVSGGIVLVFIAVHLWETRVQTWSGHLLIGSYSTKLVEHLSSVKSGVPWIALGYLVGIAATLFHLVSGMTSFCTTWGLTNTATSRHRARVFFRAIGVVFFAASAATVIALATGAFVATEEVESPGSCGSSVGSPADAGQF